MSRCEQCKKFDECQTFIIQNTQRGKFCMDFQDVDFDYRQLNKIIDGEYYWMENIIVEE